MTKWYSKIPKSLLKEWDEKLAEDGFYDIETGVGKEGHMLKGSTPSFRLIAATGQNVRSFDEVADSEDEMFDYQSGDKAEYYRIAERLCVTEAPYLLPMHLYCWCLHSQGYGERRAGEELGIPRAKVREYLAPMRLEIKRLTSVPPIG